MGNDYSTQQYRGYLVTSLTSDLIVVQRLGRYVSVEQAKRAIDHFLDRACSHRECR